MYRTGFTFVLFVDCKVIDILTEEGQEPASKLEVGSTGRNKYRQILGIKTACACAFRVVLCWYRGIASCLPSRRAPLLTSDLDRLLSEVSSHSTSYEKRCAQQ